MGCCTVNRVINEQCNEDEFELILETPCEEWTHSQVISWLNFTHDGDLSDLIEPFKLHKIFGLSFVKLTNEILQNNLNVIQFGLRDGFIAERNKLLKMQQNDNSKTDDTHVSDISTKTNNINPKYYNQTLIDHEDSNTNYVAVDFNDLYCIHDPFQSANPVNTNGKLINDVSTNVLEAPWPVVQNIHEFARNIWINLHKIDISTTAKKKELLLYGFIHKIFEQDLLNFNNKIYSIPLNIIKLIRDFYMFIEPFIKFNANELLYYVKKGLINRQNVENDSINICNHLINMKYIKLNNNNNDIKNPDVFLTNSKYLYQFVEEKHVEFVIESEPDRNAWCSGTQVEVYSLTFNGWMDGEIIDIPDKNHVIVSYGTPLNQLRKRLNRYDNVIRSSKSFLLNRNSFDKGSICEIYSNTHHVWCKGIVEEILFQNKLSMFRVRYSNNDRIFGKYVDKWSPDIRTTVQLSDKLSKFSIGTKVEIYSNHKKEWCNGIISDVLPRYNVVKVNYASHEKILPITSNDLKLVYM